MARGAPAASRARPATDPSPPPSRQDLALNTTSRQLRMVGTADLAWARRCAEATASTLADWGVRDERVMAYQAAVAEMATNVCRHGYAGRDPGRLELELAWDDAELRITVRDEGVPFDPTDAPDPVVPDPDDPDTWPESGLGLLIVRSAGDALQYRRLGNVNELSLLTHDPRTALEDTSPRS